MGWAGEGGVRWSIVDCMTGLDIGVCGCIGDGGIESWYIGVGGCSGRSMARELVCFRVNHCNLERLKGV